MWSALLLMGVMVWTWRAINGDTAAWLVRLLASAARVAEQVRSGSHEWQAEAAMEAQLGGVLEAAWRRGQPLGGSLAAWREVLADGLEVERSCLALRRLLWARTGLALATAVAARLALSRTQAGGLLQPEDEGPLAAAAVLVLASHAALARVAPRPWLGSTQGGRVQAYQWLAVHIEGTPRPGVGPEAALQSLQSRELRLGISLQAEKRQALMEWSRDSLRQARERLKRVEDWLPLLELIGVGLPLALLLARPLASYQMW